MKRHNPEIDAIADVISAFSKKYIRSPSKLDRLHAKFYDLEDCMLAILYEVEQ